MIRYVLAIAAVSFFVAANPAAAQDSPSKSLAQRFGELREGWTFSSDTGETPEPPAPQAPVATDRPESLPRVNARELMPRKWFGVGVEEVRQARQAQPPKVTKAPTVPQNGSLGSARARLLRDMRRPTVQVEGGGSRVADATRRATPRAGSALSPDAPKLDATGLTGVRKERLNEAIAAEVAKSMTEATDAEAKPETPAPASETVAESDLLDEGATPTESATVQGTVEPVEAPAEPSPLEETAEQLVDNILNEAADETVDTAEGDAGKVKVATSPTEPTKLPLFIGEGYKAFEETVSVETVPETPASPPTAKAVEAFSTPTPQPPAQRIAQANPVDTATTDSGSEFDANDFILTQRLPVLVSRVGGPRTIVVGREATYRVLLANRGDVQADQVVTEVKIPAWADVIDTKAQAGKIDATTTEDGVVVWRADRLPAGEVITLDLRLVAREGKPVELGVTHRHRPIDGRTLVEVQEPMLALQMLGPDEVLYGKPQSYRLTISNPGTGTAENVKLSLTPPGGDAQRRTQHDFGSIPAGEQRTVEIELTAREAGQLAIDAAADAEGDVSAAITKSVFCRRPELVVDWRGPSERYAGAPAVYYFRVRNPGTAMAPDVKLEVQLPAGFEVQPGTGTPAVESGKLAFRVGALAPDEDRYFELRGVMRQAGANVIALKAFDAGETRSEPVTAKTEVVALADLKLDVLDPRGPIATNQEAEYQIRVTNRGSSAAREVRIVGLFSDGIEPHHVAGAEYTIDDGRVAFETIDSLAIGEERVFTIHARAHEEGSHLFRAEVICKDIEVKLAAEETTRFFKDETINIAGDGYGGASGYAR